MIKKLICLLWGHRQIVKAATGETYQTINQMTGLPQTGHYYVYEKKPFCPRCGVDLRTYSLDSIRLMDLPTGRAMMMNWTVATPDGDGQIAGFGPIFPADTSVLLVGVRFADGTIKNYKPHLVRQL